MATGLIKSGQHDEAQRVIEQALELNWDSKLIELYAECRGVSDATGRLSRAEKWLRLHPQDDVLLLVLGRLCVEQQLWGKAKSFLEASLSIRETRNANSERRAYMSNLVSWCWRHGVTGRGFTALIV